jgi:hypothetical protein
VLWIPLAASAAGGSGYVPPAPSYDWTITIAVEGRLEPVFC